jgi:hypothetical protein
MCVQLATKCRLLLSFLQILASLPVVLNLSFPPAFQGLAHLLGVLSLSTFGLPCLGDFDYVDYMYGVTILTLVILGAFLVGYKRHDIAHWLDKEAPEVDMHTQTQFQIKIASFANMFIFLMLPAVSCAIFRMFPCQVSPVESMGASRVYVD